MNKEKRYEHAIFLFLVWLIACGWFRMDEKTFLSAVIVALIGVLLLFIGIIPAFFHGQANVPLTIFGIAILVGTAISTNFKK
jgi:hypothetical protein